MADHRTQALHYHRSGRKGKVEIVPTKPFSNQHHLSLAYTPGVAEPCLRIAGNPEDAYEYTARGNSVAVITNGTAVLGLGSIGPLAGKPVMEGKAILFEMFADIDAVDLEIKTQDPFEFIDVVKNLEPTFGGINLEDIKSPDCFVIEDHLQKEMGIPVFHDDQHGTAIISAAALLNALEIARKDIGSVRIVINGAGAAAIACARLYRTLGAARGGILLCDRQGVISKGRPFGMNVYKEEFAVETRARTLEDAMKGADVFVGLSSGGVVSRAMVQSMADTPIVFAMANPDPEIRYEDAVAARRDVIMATGRSDYPNQVNNVLGFPFVFRGALDVRATVINEEMKVAAVRALADLAKLPVPAAVRKAYRVSNLRFGPGYIIPKPFDSRALLTVAPAVARAALKTGAAKHSIPDWKEYERSLRQRLRHIQRLQRWIT
ncbi:MAG: malic enzyme-like NAD(P)-binding protein [Bacteroidota bacterium]